MLKLYFQVSARDVTIIPNGLINLEQGQKTVKLTTQQHLFQLSRNAVVQLAYMCVLWWGDFTKTSYKVNDELNYHSCVPS